MLDAIALIVSVRRFSAFLIALINSKRDIQAIKNITSKVINSIFIYFLSPKPPCQNPLWILASTSGKKKTSRRPPLVTQLLIIMVNISILQEKSVDKFRQKKKLN